MKNITSLALVLISSNLPNQTMEMWSDGDCAWVGPDAMPANPVNSAGGYLIQLAYK